jgi:Fic-DOC domain mobile mystery protein B
MGLNLDDIDGQTPLDDDEKEALLIPTITTRGELDEFEQQNIEQAVAWSLGRSFKAENVFTEDFLKTVHKRMYGDVWAWAGEFRYTNKNIGVDKWQIPTEVRTLLDDVKYWHANNTYSSDECTIRFKHRLVSIHCFPNGNGRHSRLIADIVVEKIFKQTIYTWGAGNLVKQGDPRAAYLKAIKAADAGDIQPLIDFART